MMKEKYAGTVLSCTARQKQMASNWRLSVGFLLAILVVAGLVGGPAANAQVYTSSLTGVAMDPSAAVVPCLLYTSDAADE